MMEPNDVGPAVGGDLRVSDKDRDQVIEVLNSAYSEGRLTPDEHDERVSAATTARTFDDLIPLTRDLVPLNTPIPAIHPQPAPDSNLPVIDRRSTGESETLVGVFGGADRTGKWRARKKINSYALFGGNDLDFTEAVFEDDVIEITGVWIFGGDDIIVPEGVNVRNEVVGIFGGSGVKNLDPHPGGPTIVLRGLALFGGVDVKGPRKKKKS